MKHIIYEFYQGNMYCNMCLINIAAVLSRLNNIAGYAVDINKKMIRVVFRRSAPDKKIIGTLINQALTGSVSSQLPERLPG